MSGFEKILFISSYIIVRFTSPTLYHYADENFVTAFVPSDTACFASSPGNINLTDVCISLEDKVAFLLYVESFPASVAILSKISSKIPQE